MDTSINVYPNPSKNGIFNLDNAYDWSIFDVVGKKVAEGKGSAVNLEKQSKGFYFLKIDNKTEKIIIE